MSNGHLILETYHLIVPVLNLTKRKQSFEGKRRVEKIIRVFVNTQKPFI
jgi:hypothetical protein